MTFPDPPFLTHHLLESPWLFLFILLGFGGAIFIKGSRDGRPRLQQAALIPLGLAASLLLIATFVQTDREQIIQSTRGFFSAAAKPLDIEQFEGLLAPDAELDGRHWRLDRDELIRTAKRVVNTYDIRSHAFARIDPHTDRPGHGRTHVVIITRAGRSTGPIRSEWLLSWTRDPDHRWRLTRLQLIEINGGQPTRLP